MEKKKNVKLAGSKVILGAITVLVVMASSCKKDASIVPDSSKVSTPAVVQSTIAVSGQYKVSQPIVLNGAHDMTISGYSITGGSASCIDLTNCYNIHVTNCQLNNSDKLGINLSGCKNIIIDNCAVSNVQTGIYAFNSSDIKVNDNTIKNVTGAARVFVAFENNNTDTCNPASNVMTNTLMQ